MNEKTLKVGIIGVGNIGNAHGASLARGSVAGMELAALCDISEEKREECKNRYDVPIFDDGIKMMESGLVDTIIVATPHYLHPYFVKEALSRKLNVISEKPAGVMVSEVKKLNEFAEKNGGNFGIMFNQRTDSLFIKAKEIIEKGELGVPKRLVWIVTNWYRTQNYYESGDWRATWKGEGGGVLLNQAPHNLDIWQWLFGMPKRIRAFCYEGKYHNIPVEDDATIYAEYENGATATFITTTGEAPGTNRLEIVGDRGKLVLEKGTLTFSKLDVPEREFCYSSDKGFDIPCYETKEYKEEILRDGHELILEDFAKAVIKGGKLLSPGVEGVNELMISNAAYLSSWTDSWVDLPMSDDECRKFDELLSRKKEEEQKKKRGEKDLSLDDKYNERWTVRW